MTTDLGILFVNLAWEFFF